MSKFIFIAGAPRSGTTFLTQQLGTSPDIIPSNEGASYYFMDKIHPLLNKHSNYYKNGIEGFQDVFPGNVAPYYLDGTDHLMYQLSMMEVIAGLPRKKMIFILREPAERIYSSFNYTKNNLGNFKKDISFKSYVDALLKDDKNLIQSWMTSEKKSGFVLSHELEYSHYHFYISKWLEIIGKENIIFLSFDNMMKDKEIFVNQLLVELKLSPIKISDHHKNESYGIKNKSIHHKISRISSWFPTSGLKDKVKKIYLGFQKEKIIKTKEDEEQIDRLKNIFKDSNKKILGITGIDVFGDTSHNKNE